MSKNTPKDYDRWGKIGIKVVSKPTDHKKDGNKNA